MFDDLRRALKALEQPTQVSFGIPIDEDGYLDRLCPWAECGAEFKVLYSDWVDKVSDTCRCPFCGYSTGIRPKR